MYMKKILFYIMASVLPLATMAETLTPEQALRRAESSGTVSGLRMTRSSADLVYTATTESLSPAVYVFENPGADGFVMLSADDLAVPVLGYSDSGKFDSENMPPQMKWWLGEYARQIEYAATNGIKPGTMTMTRSVGEEIAPMIKTKWDQTAPFNNECPKDGGVNCVTGCVATAMAQVMYFWKYPEKGEGVVTARVNNVTTASLDLSTITFDWANMTETYDNNSTPAQKKAVAMLMKACGYAVDMGYTKSESGAQTVNIAKALVENFGYNKNITFQQRNYYAGSEWDRLVYEELKAGRPVLYSGATLTSAHQFVCDGYDGKGYFHINWGWRGMSDGYFALEALDPGSQGTGGSVGGFNFGQTIMQGVQKATTQEAYSSMGLSGGNLVATAAGLNVTVKVTEGGFISNTGYKNISNAITGFVITPVDGTTKSAVTCWEFGKGSDPLKPGWGWSAYDGGKPNINFSFLFPNGETIKDGQYVVQLAYKYIGSQEWFPIVASAGYSSSFKVTKKGNSLTVINPTVKSFTVDGDIEGDVYNNGMPVKFRITVKNESDMELTQGVYPGLYNGSGDLQYGAEGFMLTLKPGQEVTKEWIGSFSLMNGQKEITTATSFMMRFFNPETWIAYSWSKPVTMKVNSGKVDVNSAGVSFPGLTYGTKIPANDGSEIRDGYLVNSTTIPLEFTLNNIGTAYFGYRLYATLVPYDHAGGAGSYGIASEALPVIPSVESGKMQTITTEVTFPEIEKDKSYFIAIQYDYNNTLNWIYPYQYVFFKLNPSGVEGVEADDSGMTLTYDKATSEIRVTSDNGVSDVKVVSISGATVKTAEGVGSGIFTTSLSDLQSGVYVIVATSSDGSRKTLKVVR